MLLILFAQVHQNMTTICVGDSGGIESLVSGLALVDALVDRVVYPGTLSLALGVGFKLAF